MARRQFLAAVSALAFMPMVSACANQQSRMFGLSLSDIEATSVPRARSTAETLGKHLDVVNVYEAFSFQQRFPKELLDSISSIGATPEITWEPWDPTAGAVQPQYSLAEIAGGRYDDYITNWAADAAHFTGRLLMRFAHEMNGNWYPWSVDHPGNGPRDYVAAYQRVHQIFLDVGASKVEWVWSPNVVIHDDRELISQSYPGDDVVSIIGVDGYNFGDVAGHQWTAPEALFNSTLELVRAIAPSKPVWINEVGCSDHGGDKARWFTELIHFLMTTDVSGLILFEANKPGEADWRIADTPAKATLARSALKSW